MAVRDEAPVAGPDGVGRLDDLALPPVEDDWRGRPTGVTYRSGMLRRVALAIGLAASALTGCGSHDGGTPTSAARCQTTGDLRLVYTGAAGEGGGDLFGLTVDGHVRRLTDDGGSFGPAFSPDGDRIVFSSIGEDGSANGDTGVSGLDLHVMAADGSGRQRLLDGDEDGMPAWSPDGHRIAFVRRVDSDHSRILVVDPDTPASARTLVEPNAGAYDTDPAWSPDGAALAFIRSLPGEGPQGSRRHQLIVVDAQGSNARTILERDVPLGSPSWDPQASAIAFTLGPPGERTGSIAVVDLDDGALHVTAGPGRAPVWSRSGRLYAYARNPAVDDFSGEWRVAELEPDRGGFSKGRTVSVLEPIGYLYGDVGLDVPRCDDPDSPALTSDADLPDTLMVTNPATADEVKVLARGQLLESGMSGLPDGGDVDTKLVHRDALANALDWSLDPEASVDLTWVIAYVPPPGQVGHTTLLDATTGHFLGSGPNMTDERWSALIDLAP